MLHTLATRAPFSFEQSLTFIQRFPPNYGEYILGTRSLTAAIAIDGRAVPFTVRAVPFPVRAAAPVREVAEPSRARRPARPRSPWIPIGRSSRDLTSPLAVVGAVAVADARPLAQADAVGSDALEVEAPDDVAASELLPRVAAWLGTEHDLGAFYAAADDDTAFRPLVRALFGLHHVAFMTLAEIAVYCVMMQRQPIASAARMKARFLDRFGLPVQVGDTTLRAMPELAALALLDGDAIGEAIRHRVKGPAIATVVRGVAALGERFLREAPYAVARDALLAIPGIGPFSAGAILLRGLGRMDELPTPDIAGAEARALYGSAYDPTAIARRYGTQIGYWSFYVKTGVARHAVG